MQGRAFDRNDEYHGIYPVGQHMHVPVCEGTLSQRFNCILRFSTPSRVFYTIEPIVVAVVYLCNPFGMHQPTEELDFEIFVADRGFLAWEGGDGTSMGMIGVRG